MIRFRKLGAQFSVTRKNKTKLTCPDISLGCEVNQITVQKILSETKVCMIDQPLIDIYGVNCYNGECESCHITEQVCSMKSIVRL
jgi:hypothetical protein